MPDAEIASTSELIELAASGKLDAIQTILEAEKLAGAGQPQLAIELYRAWLKNPLLAVAHGIWFNLAILLTANGSQAEAEAAYRQAIALKPDFPQAHYNLGVQIENQGRQREAAEYWRASLSLESLHLPEHSNTLRLYFNALGRLYDNFSEYADAEEMLRQSLEIDPTQGDVIYHWLHIRQKQCSWPALRPLPQISEETIWEKASPLAIMAMTDDPARLLQTARSFVDSHVQPKPRMVRQGHDYGHAKIRIGFLSGDFTLHAVSLLTVRLFEALDRSKYEVYAFGWGRTGYQPFRQRVVAAFDQFFDISGLTDDDAALAICSHEIDVLVDLQGLTAGARPNIVAHGPAPHQIAHLGYPGTSAIPYVDYVLADKFIFPPEMAPFFTERPLYLSDCFQVSDDLRTRALDDNPEKYGLPRDKFIFCGFSNNFKITPEVFESWMRILRRTPNSILWLLRDNQWAEENMLAAAKAHGVLPERLYFADRVAPENYLARFGVAHLFLDTFPYNAGTTANDAMWAELPIVTLSGRSYVSRMAGSLLSSAGLGQLIAFTHEEFEDKAVAFAGDRQLQLHCKEKLRAAKTDSAAFNTGKFAQEFGAIVERLVRHDDSLNLQMAVGQ
ncbi:MAG: tetratricopeptide repeat protein [Burkholderiaceae bacterium]|nr:tetratricopeptide repeat protein [Burkholderiaceae bacterium]